MANRFPLEGIAVTQQEAVMLCIYHLRIAAALFELVPEDGNQSLSGEIDRTFDEGFGKAAARLWADGLLALYDSAEAADGA
jgi:hypothetical protein